MGARSHFDHMRFCATNDCLWKCHASPAMCWPKLPALVRFPASSWDCCLHALTCCSLTFHCSVARAIPPEDREDQEGSFYVFRRIVEEEVRGRAGS